MGNAAPMNARPEDPSATLYAPASTCVNVLTKYDDGIVESREAYTYGYGLIYVKGDKLFYDPRNFLTRGQRLSFLLRDITSVSVERDAVNDIYGLGTCPCYSCPCRGCPDGTVHIAMSQAKMNQEENLYMQMPNSQDFVDRFNQQLGRQTDTVTSQPSQ